MTKLGKKLATCLGASAIAIASVTPAMAFDAERDANIMAYWKMDFGPTAKDEDRTAFGFAANKDLSVGSNSFGYTMDQQRPAFVDIQFSGSNAMLDSVSFNGTNVLTKTTQLNADGSEGVVFGLEWWQIAVGVAAVGTAVYLVSEAVDDDDDDSSGGGGGGGTTGTPLDVVLDPLAGAAGGGAPASPI